MIVSYKHRKTGSIWHAIYLNMEIAAAFMHSPELVIYIVVWIMSSQWKAYHL